MGRQRLRDRDVSDAGDVQSDEMPRWQVGDRRNDGLLRDALPAVRPRERRRPWRISMT